LAPLVFFAAGKQEAQSPLNKRQDDEIDTIGLYSRAHKTQEHHRDLILQGFSAFE
jgi:hypothetical protein